VEKEQKNACLGMDLIAAMVIVVVIAGVLVMAMPASRRKRTERLKQKFGPEYERTVSEAGEQQAAEKELVAREHKRDKLDIHPLTAGAREGYSPTAHTESEIADTQSAARTIDAAPAPSEAESDSERSLFADDELAGLRARWDNVQAAFVDDPKDCVHKADSLVSDVVKQLTTGFTEARSRLEQQ
jgi:hypothetical protein